jgi:integrase/recombinase XerD
LALAAVRDIRDRCAPASVEELDRFEVDVLAGFVLARAAAGLADATIRSDIGNLEQIRDWFGRPLWEMEPTDADAYFGRAMRTTKTSTRLARALALTTYFDFLEVRHKVEIHAMTGRIVECPIDEMNRPRGNKDAKLRIPPQRHEIDQLFSGWSAELASCRKFAPTARNYTVARLMAGVGLRVNEVCRLDLTDVKWELGPFGKLHVRYGKGANGSGPRERMAPMINGVDRTVRWFIEDVWSAFGGDHQRAGVALFPSERGGNGGYCGRAGDDAVRLGLKDAVRNYLPAWEQRLTPHVLRHYWASELYLSGVDLISVQELLGHAWIATTMRYVHVHRTRIEQAWLEGQQRAGRHLEGLTR